MPDFSSKEYWETRFTKDAGIFDWLLPAQTLREIVSEWFEEPALKKSEVLHIGCGTSDAPVLCEFVEKAGQIHNVDYSRAAINAAIARENESLQKRDPSLIETGSRGDSVQLIEASRMRWSCLDLLSLDSVLSLLDQQMEAGQLFDLVLDKSTSDSIACGSNVSVWLPYPLSINGWTRAILQSGVAQPAEIYPLHVLAVHLAALTKPRTGKWIVISYSEERLPFFPPFPQAESQGFLPESVIKAGFPHPSQLWRLETKEKIDLNAKREETLAERRKRLNAGRVHRPQVSHWLYVMVRTDVLVTD